MDMMSKRSQGKSTFFGAINYKDRVFVLDSRSFRYFAGNLKACFCNLNYFSVSLSLFHLCLKKEEQDEKQDKRSRRRTTRRRRRGKFEEEEEEKKKEEEEERPFG